MDNSKNAVPESSSPPASFIEESNTSFSYLNTFFSGPMRLYQNTSSFVRQVAWPTSLADGRRSELALLRHGGIPKIPSHSCLIYNVKIIQDGNRVDGEGTENSLGFFSRIYQTIPWWKKSRQPDCFIHTCAVDASDSGLSDLKFTKNSIDVEDPLANENDESLTLRSSLSSSSPHFESKKSPIVICHGFGAGLAFFFKNLWSISSSTGRRVYAMDWIGMGRSSRPSFANYLSGKVEDRTAKVNFIPTFIH